MLLATINVVGGFVVTDRMLLMFSGKPRRGGGGVVKLLPPEVVTVCYIVAAVLFILALKGLSNPRTARRANLLGAAGAAIAVARLHAERRAAQPRSGSSRRSPSAR